MKKSQILMRIMACVLIIILALGIIVPVVASATELTPEPNNSYNAGGLTQAPSGDTDNEDGGMFTTIDTAMPTKALPDGLEYAKQDNSWIVRKVNGNNNFSVIVDGLPDNFDSDYLTFFIGNVETHEVTSVEVMNAYSFAKVIDLSPGYYVIFANNYAFCDSKDKAYAIEGGQMKYFYVGNDYDSNKFPVTFEDGTTNLMHLTLKDAPDGYSKIKQNQRVAVSSTDLTYPSDANIGSAKTATEKSNTGDTDKSKDTSSDSKVSTDKKKESSGLNSFFNTLKNVVSRSFLLIIGIIICFVATTVIKSKKKAALEEQSENDKNDDGHID